VRYQLKRLKYETYVFTAQLGSAVFAQLGEIFTNEFNYTTAGRIEASQHAEQGAFSRAGCTHNRNAFSGADAK
jgi:hypothetical protein